jgi:hypothetical protein
MRLGDQPTRYEKPYTLLALDQFGQDALRLVHLLYIQVRTRSDPELWLVHGILM